MRGPPACSDHGRPQRHGSYLALVAAVSESPVLAHAKKEARCGQNHSIRSYPRFPSDENEAGVVSLELDPAHREIDARTRDLRRWNRVWLRNANPCGSGAILSGLR